MRLASFLSISLLASCLALPLWGQDGGGSPTEDSFQIEVESQVATMAGRLSTLEMEREFDYPHFVRASRHSIGALMKRLLRLGADQLIEMAPRFQGIEAPSPSDPTFFAMVRYGLCHIYLEQDFQQAPLGGLSQDQMLSAAMGPTYLDLVTAYLGVDYLEHGGSESALTAFLTDPELESLSLQIAATPDLVEETRAGCHPVMELLFGANELPELPW